MGTHPTIVAPHFLIDISTLAACFAPDATGNSDRARRALQYTINRMRPRQVTGAILLGHFAGAAIDIIMNARARKGAMPTFAAVLRRSFRDHALDYCACEDFNPQQFKRDAERQMVNIVQMTDRLFGSIDAGGSTLATAVTTIYDPRKAILEPSFVCRQLGLQGRVDLMTTDLRLLVEQKSGRNWFLSGSMRTPYGSLFSVQHYVQLLLYDAVLRTNFSNPHDAQTDSTHHSSQPTCPSTDLYLLYSKFSADKGLLPVPFHNELFREAIQLRNDIVTQEITIARQGFETIIDRLPTNLIDTSSLSSLERKYLCRMMTFVYREQLTGRLTDDDADNRYTGMTIAATEQDDKGRWLLTLSIDCTTSNSPDFRRGDMVYVYRYEGEADLCRGILYRGNIKEIAEEHIVVALMGDQRIVGGTQGLFAVEHCPSYTSTSAAMRSLRNFITSPETLRRLLLGKREPQRDTTLTLSRSRGSYFDHLLLKAKRAQDYFLLVGPPGTGKTSMALRYIVEEEPGNILLAAFTNRAVDEICSMLEEAGMDYLRIGSEHNCGEQYVRRLISRIADSGAGMQQVRQQIMGTRIVVGTTSMLQAQPSIFVLKRFALTVIDEAGQILEPDVVGLLSLAKSKFVLIGDYKQLPAVVQQEAKDSVVTDAELNAAALTDCRNSLFERLLTIERRAGRTAFVGVLNRQGRMHPDVARFPTGMFYYSEGLTAAGLPHQEETVGEPRVVFIPAKTVDEEAHIVATELMRVYASEGDRFSPARSVGIIVPYRHQIARIRRELSALPIPADVLSSVSIDTVERYQGSQRDVIIFSFTAQTQADIDFLTAGCITEEERVIDRKLNVVLTRARKRIICTGNEQVLRCNPLYARYIDYVRDVGGYRLLNNDR